MRSKGYWVGRQSQVIEMRAQCAVQLQQSLRAHASSSDDDSGFLPIFISVETEFE